MKKEEKELWVKLKKTGSESIKRQIAEMHLNLVRFVVEKVSYNSAVINKADLVNVGVIGLMKAIEKFDIAKNTKFSTYAYMKIYGSIMDYIRETDWTPRSVRDKLGKLEEAYMRLTARGIYNPHDSQVASELGMTMDDYYRFIDGLHVNQVMSLEELANFEDSETASRDKMFGKKEKQELKEMVASIIDKCLDEKEKVIISLYYYEELTLKEIAGIMKFTEARISQIHAKAITKIKAHIAASSVAAL